MTQLRGLIDSNGLLTWQPLLRLLGQGLLGLEVPLLCSLRRWWPALLIS